ncbi:MAG: hypothetical protein D3916_00980 [Candidatus Electrothrix sp. MAN1_4]|nr:hypothetical protein [Candidatus Electrothrix sp. MAN1_4]
MLFPVPPEKLVQAYPLYFEARDIIVDYVSTVFPGIFAFYVITVVSEMLLRRTKKAVGGI